jgi:hypothetical protein
MLLARVYCDNNSLAKGGLSTLADAAHLHSAPITEFRQQEHTTQAISLAGIHCIFPFASHSISLEVVSTQYRKR